MINREERILVTKPLYEDNYIHIVVSHIAAYKFYTVCNTPITLIFLDGGARFEVEMSMEEFYKTINGDNDAGDEVSFEDFVKSTSL